MWSHSSSSGWLIGPRRACAIFQSAWGDGWSRETSTPCLATPNLCSSFLQRKGWGESSGNHLLFLVYFIPTLDQDHNLPRVLLPFHPHLHKCILLFLVLIVFETVLSSPSLLCLPIQSSCWKQQCCDGSRCFSVAIATGARKPRMTATLQELSRLHLSSPSPSFWNLN